MVEVFFEENQSWQVDVAVHDAFPNQMEGLLALDNVKNAKKKPVWADTPADCAKDADVSS